MYKPLEGFNELLLLHGSNHERYYGCYDYTAATVTTYLLQLPYDALFDLNLPN